MVVVVVVVVFRITESIVVIIVYPSVSCGSSRSWLSLGVRRRRRRYSYRRSDPVGIVRGIRYSRCCVRCGSKTRNGSWLDKDERNGDQFQSYSFELLPFSTRSSVSSPPGLPLLCVVPVRVLVSFSTTVLTVFGLLG